MLVTGTPACSGKIEPFTIQSDISRASGSAVGDVSVNKRTGVAPILTVDPFQPLPRNLSTRPL
jgi:hypothetical protein